MISSIFVNDRIFKFISIIGFIFILFIVVILLFVGPATSYDFSIYDAYPWYFWIFIISALICGQLVIIGSVITQSKKNNWLFGLWVILIANAILLFLPMIRGYYVNGSGDVLTHIGYMKDILQTSNIGADHYPIDHILGVTIYLISGLSLPDITLIIPPFFSFFFILSIYFVGKTVFQKKSELLILVLLTTILIVGDGHLAFVPNAQAFFLVPLMLFLAFKMYTGVNVKRYNILLLLISFLIVFYHPLVTVMVIFMLCIFQIIQYIPKKYGITILKKVNYVYTIIFIVIVFSIWSKYLRMATNLVEPIFLRIYGEAEAVIPTELQKNTQLISQVTVDPIYLLKLIFNVYGQWILLGILSFISIGFILNSMKNQKSDSNFFMGSSIMAFILFFMLSVFMLFNNGNFGFNRVYSFANLFSLLLIPTGIYIFLYYNSSDKSISRKTLIKLFGIIFIIFCVTFFSIFNLYLSPIVKSTNQQVPKSDYIGMNTFFSYRDESLPIKELGISSYRIYDAMYGHYAKRKNINFSNNSISDHFGYQNETLSNNLTNNSKYILINDLGRGFYPHMYPEFPNNWHFLSKDFEQLKFDTKFKQVYSNRNLEIFIL